MRARNTRLKIVLAIFTLFLLSGDGRPSTSQISSQSANPESSPRLAGLQEQIRQGDRSAVIRFWEEVRKIGSPLVEPLPHDHESVLVTFLWRGGADTRNVVIFLQAGGLNPADNQMTRLPESDVW